MTTDDLVITIIVEFVRLSVCYRAFNIFFEKGENIIKRHAIFLTSFAVTTIPYILFGQPLINFSFTLIGLLILSITYRGLLSRKIFFSLVLMAVSVAIDFFATFVFTINPYSQNFSILSTITSVLMFMTAEFLIEKYNSKKAKNSVGYYWKYFVLILFLSILSMLILALDLTISKLSVITMSGAMLLINFGLIFLYSRLSDSVNQERENQILKEQMNAYSNELKIRAENDKNLNIIRHDMRHHFQEIYELSKRNNTEKIKAYIEKIDDVLIDSKIFSDSGNPAIDSVLNYMLSRAEQAGIDVLVHIAIPEKIEISEFDINVILGNLLENAIEACHKEEDPWIKVIMKYNSTLCIEISNCCTQHPTFINGQLITAKKTTVNEHGLGLTSVKEAVTRNYGLFSFEFNGNIFKAKVML